MRDFVQIDTTNILFVCGGAFDGLEKIIRNRWRRAASASSSRSQAQASVGSATCCAKSSPKPDQVGSDSGTRQAALAGGGDARRTQRGGAGRDPHYAANHFGQAANGHGALLHSFSIRQLGGAEGAILQDVLRDWPVNIRRQRVIHVPASGEPLPGVALDGDLEPHPPVAGRQAARAAGALRSDVKPRASTREPEGRGRADREAARPQHGSQLGPRAARPGFGKDTSAPNGSSIAFLAEPGRTRVLFAADALPASWRRAWPGWIRSR